VSHCVPSKVNNIASLLSSLAQLAGSLAQRSKRGKASLERSFVEDGSVIGSGVTYPPSYRRMTIDSFGPLAFVFIEFQNVSFFRVRFWWCFYIRFDSIRFDTVTHKLFDSRVQLLSDASSLRPVGVDTQLDLDISKILQSGVSSRCTNTHRVHPARVI